MVTSIITLGKLVETLEEKYKVFVRLVLQKRYYLVQYPPKR